MTCRNDLLVYNGSDVKALCHGYIIDVLYHSNGLSHAETLGCQTCQDVGFGVASECHESLSALYSFVDEQRNVASIAVDDEHTGVVYDVVKMVAARLISVYYLHVHVLGHGLYRPDGSGTTAHYHHALDVDIVFFTHNLADIWYELLRGHEVSEVVKLQRVVTTRYDCFAATLDCHHVVGVVGSAKVFQGLVKNLASLTQLYAEHHESASMHVPTLSYPRHLQAVVDVLSCQHLRVNE